MPKIRLLIVQPTPFCNIDCTYCYLPDRRSKHVVAMETLANLFSQVFASGWARDHLTVVWHAGEPMVMPVAFYAEAFRLVDRLKPAGLQLIHSFQTNGTLINEAWCDFFLAERVNLGVSVDGPREFHDLSRRTRSGQGTFARTIAGIRLLRRRQVPFHVISVLTTASMNAPETMFEFYVGEGIERVCFNVEESEGSHASPSLGRADAGLAYRKFLETFWRLSGALPGKITFIREIEHALSAVLRPAEGTFFNELVEPFAVTSMDCAGNVSTFSPELLGLKNEEYGDFILGNVNRDNLADLAASPVLQRMHADVAAGVALCRERCQYFSVCGGGEPVNKLSENGSFVSTETAFCRLTRMHATDLILDTIERLDPKELAAKRLATQSAESAGMLEAVGLATM